MTLAAVEPVRVTIPEQDRWVTPEINPAACQFPGCPRPGSQWHHIVRRTETAGPKDWIAIDGVVIWNKARLCLWCHDGINTHKYWITYDEEDGGWIIWVRDSRSESSLGSWRQHPKSGDRFVRVGQLGRFVAVVRAS